MKNLFFQISDNLTSISFSPFLNFFFVLGINYKIKTILTIIKKVVPKKIHLQPIIGKRT